MKHNKKITIILITMFLVTQLIGLYVVKFYNQPDNILPFGMEPPEEINPETSIFSILIAFIFAITLFFILTRLNLEKFIKLWFFMVTTIAIGLALNVFLYGLNHWYDSLSLLSKSIILFIIASPLAFFKIVKRDFVFHNLTELLIYPGIAAVFVPLLNVMGVIILLLIISFYDMWAVWRSQFMQKMAKYQINNLRIFTGFFIPYANKKQKLKIKQIKQKYSKKGEKVLEKQFKKAKIKVNLAILGGGDIIFPIIASGVFYKIFGLIPALTITITSTLALLTLFIMARKGKFYPAMPFLTSGIYIGMIINWLFLI